MKSRAREELHQHPAVGHKPYCDYVEAIMLSASSSAPLWLFIMSESLSFHCQKCNTVLCSGCMPCTIYLPVDGSVDAPLSYFRKLVDYWLT